MIGSQILPQQEPWREIPARIGAKLVPHLPALSDEVIAAIRDGVPAYRRPLTGRFGAGIKLGVEEALGQFAELIANPDLDRTALENVYRGLGRGEYRGRRSLDALLAAYRIGARVSWRRVAGVAIDANVDRHTLALLAESVFAYIDGISALSAEGYAEEQSAAAGETQRRRRRLARLLLDPEQDPDEVALAAADAGWEIPGTVGVLAWSTGGARLRGRLPADALVLADEGGESGVALLGDAGAPGLERQLRAALAGTAVLGPDVPLTRAAQSAERARATLALIDDGELEVSGLVLAGDHLASLLVHAEPGLLRELAATLLAPLDPETPASRARLLATLRAWLAHQGEVGAIARELHVHPQTVRYRLARLRERLGPALEDPARRFELNLALRAPDPVPKRPPRGSRRRRG